MPDDAGISASMLINDPIVILVHCCVVFSQSIAPPPLICSDVLKIGPRLQLFIHIVCVSCPAEKHYFNDHFLYIIFCVNFLSLGDLKNIQINGISHLSKMRLISKRNIIYGNLYTFSNISII